MAVATTTAVEEVQEVMFVPMATMNVAAAIPISAAIRAMI